MYTYDRFTSLYSRNSHNIVKQLCCGCFWLVAQSCLTLCDPMNCSTPGLFVHHQLLESTQTHVHCVSDGFNHLILCHPLLLLPSIFPRIRVFSNELALCIRWPNDWSFSSTSVLPTDFTSQEK